MFEGIEALRALSDTGTVSQAAVKLRLTQSAVSKRLAALKEELGFELTENNGRRVVLSAEARSFLEQALPLLCELQDLKTNHKLKSKKAKKQKLSIALSDSLASSWAPQVLQKALQKTQNLELEIHVHRSVLILESVRLGKYSMGLCVEPWAGKDMQVFKLLDEELFILPKSFKKIESTTPFICIEEASATWQHVGEKILKQLNSSQKNSLLRVESFQAAMQLVEAGFGNGVLPRGVLELNKKAMESAQSFSPKITRPISLVTRSTIAQQVIFEQFLANLKEAITF